MFKSVNVLRLSRSQKLLSELTSYCREKNISSAIILGIIGSLESATFGTQAAGKKPGTYVWEDHQGPLTILSSHGSLSEFEDKNIFHIHMGVVDAEGKTLGGHLQDAVVWALVEIYIGELDYQLCRDYDPESGQSAVRTT